MLKGNSIAEALEQAVAEGVFPGAVLLVRQGSDNVYLNAVGRVSQSPIAPLVVHETVYDLASLTKPLATATAILCLVQDGKMRLDQTVKDWLHEVADHEIGRVTIHQLLCHASGLPAWRPFYQKLSLTGRPPSDPSEVEIRKAHMIRLIGEEELEKPSCPKTLYSDLGFILLGLLIERCTKQSLASYCEERFLAKLNAIPFGFIGPDGFSQGQEKLGNDVAPTEEDSWRARLIHGEVHDENAYALGGIAGHAGLFGTAQAVSIVAAEWLNSIRGRSSLFASKLAKQFVTRKDQTSQSSWALGWDTPSEPSSCGTRFSSQSFGHLGFTGASFWIHPERDICVVLLSNRVHPSRDNTKIQAFRPFIHDLVFEQFVK